MKKVLIMEDELNIRSFVVINLKRAGYDAIEAGNGQEALDAIAQTPDIGVAILDIMVPGTWTALRSAAASAPPTS
ncbi:MAG: response regulator transcription factor, partial [Oscillospiraceae bacterium]